MSNVSIFCATKKLESFPSHLFPQFVKSQWTRVSGSPGEPVEVSAEAGCGPRATWAGMPHLEPSYPEQVPAVAPGNGIQRATPGPGVTVYPGSCTNKGTCPLRSSKLPLMGKWQGLQAGARESEALAFAPARRLWTLGKLLPAPALQRSHFIFIFLEVLKFFLFKFY